MGRLLSANEEELYRMTDEVLHYIWDPIGVAAAPQARDEYYGYVPRVFDLLLSNTEASQIAAYLHEVATEGMGLPGDTEHELKVARLLLQYKEAVFAKLA